MGFYEKSVLLMEIEKRSGTHKRLLHFSLVLIGVFAVLIFRLFYLQVVKAEDFQAQSEQNSTRFVFLLPKRGDILDRNQKVLATTTPYFAISITNEGQNVEEIVTKTLAIINDPELKFEEVMKKITSNPYKYEPVEIYRFPSDAEGAKIVSRLEEVRDELPGVEIITVPQRIYPEGELAGHVLGHLGEITKEELQTLEEKYYTVGDLLGKSGIEYFMEDVLRGQKGYRQIEVNAQNRFVRELLVIPPLAGNNLILTIDADLQKTLEDSLERVVNQAKKENPKSNAGAGVVIDVRSGAILALASYPPVNPNDYVDGDYNKKLDYYENQTLKPSLNRATMAAYPPGSTFKPITGMAALDSGQVMVDDPPITCNGAYWKKPYIKCWATHGKVDFYRGFAVSCNTYFQYIGERAGIDAIVKVAKEFGLGEKTGSPDLAEVSGLLPSPQWKKETSAAIIDKRYQAEKEELNQKYNELLAQAENAAEKEELLKEKKQKLNQLEANYQIDYNFETTWQPFDTYNTSIGQGSNSYTMLQLANYVATLANGGIRYVPYLVDSVIDPNGKEVEKFKPRIAHQVTVSEENMAAVRKGMELVTQPGGTAYARFSDFPAAIKVAGKTGTAQTSNKNEDFHGVFVGFAPYDNPEIAIATIVEYGTGGSASAAKIARDVFADYFNLNLPPQ